MKKLAIVVLFVFAGCHRQVKVASTTSAPADLNATGAATASEAVQKFLAAAKAQDIQAMTSVWGTSSGPIRGTKPTEEIEQRSIYIMRCLRYDSYSILNETQATGGDRLLTVQVKRGTVAPQANFTATLGPQNRWYMREFQLEALNPICTSK